MLDDADGGDLVVARVDGQIAEVAVLHQAAPGEPLPRDARGGELGLGPRQRHPVRADAVVLGGPDGEAPPPAADVEQGLAGLEPQLAAHQIQLVRLGLLQLAVGVPVVRARVDHERVEEESVELVGLIVVVRDGLGVPLLAPPHEVASFMPKIESKTTRRRARAEPSTARTARRASASGSRAICRPIHEGSPGP